MGRSITVDDLRSSEEILSSMSGASYLGSCSYTRTIHDASKGCPVLFSIFYALLDVLFNQSHFSDICLEELCPRKTKVLRRRFEIENGDVCPSIMESFDREMVVALSTICSISTSIFS